MSFEYLYAAYINGVPAADFNAGITYPGVIYVNSSVGSDANDGSYNHPLATITAALNKPIEAYRSVIVLGGNVYNEQLILDDYTSLYAPTATIQSTNASTATITYAGAVSAGVVFSSIINNDAGGAVRCAGGNLTVAATSITGGVICDFGSCVVNSDNTDFIRTTDAGASLVFRGANCQIAEQIAGTLICDSDMPTDPQGYPLTTPAFIAPMYNQSNVFYVSQQFGNDGNSGQYSQPFQTVTAAMGAITGGRAFVEIIDGATYTESNIPLKPNTTLWGPAATIVSPTTDPAIIYNSFSDSSITLFKLGNGGGPSAQAIIAGGDIALDIQRIEGSVTHTTGGEMMIRAKFIAGDVLNNHINVFTYIDSMSVGSITNSVGTMIANVARSVGTITGTVYAPSTNALLPSPV